MSRRTRWTAVIALLILGPSPAAHADSISDLRVVVDTPTLSIVSVAYTYDSANGDCVTMRGVADDGAIGWTRWPVRPGSHHAFLTLRNTSAGTPATTEVDARMERCDGGLVHEETFPFARSWAATTDDFLATGIESLAEAPDSLTYRVRYQLASSHSGDVRIWPVAIEHGGSAPFSQGSTPSDPLSSGSFGTATGTVSFATSGTGSSDALLLEMREDGGTPFFAAVVPREKYWSDDTTDTDGDGISDASEFDLGTNLAVADSDGDGLQDGWELEGYRWTDGQQYPDSNLPLLGADPLRKDVFVEIDYTVAGGRDQKMHPDSMQAAKELYAATDVPNPDGSTGIDLHLFHDDAIAASGGIGGVCGARDYLGFFPERKNRIYHWAVAGPGEGGQGEVTSNRFVFGTGNGNPGMDTRSRFMGFAVFVHELGHNLGLLHQGRNGSDQSNCKANYFSLMNYAYDYSIDCSESTLADTQIRFSDGDAPALDMTLLSEDMPPSGLQEVEGFDKDWLDCNVYGVTSSPARIDWDMSGTIDTGTVSVSSSDDAPSCADEGAETDQRDSDDFSTMATNMATAIASPSRASCDGAGAQNGYMELVDTSALQPVCGVALHEGLLAHPWARPNPVFEIVPGTVLTHPQMIYELSPIVGANNDLSDPEVVDQDQDQIPDVDDNCLGLFNPTQEDPNQDGIGTACQCGDADFDGVLEQEDVDALAACASSPQTCQLDPAHSDTDADGQFTQADVDALSSHLADPVANPVQDLRCGNRPSGLAPAIAVPEPSCAWLLAVGAGALALLRRGRHAGR